MLKAMNTELIRATNGDCDPPLLELKNRAVWPCAGISAA